MKEYARSFYNSKAWRLCSRGFMLSKDGLCERCGRIADICHHKTYITPENINDPEITLNWDNLEALCQDCHNKEHFTKGGLTYFDAAGDIRHVKESQEVRDFQQAAAKIDGLMEKLAELKGPGAANE